MRTQTLLRALLLMVTLGGAFASKSHAQEVQWRRGGLIYIPKVMQFSADGKRLFTAGDNGIKVWDTTTGAFLHTWTDPDFGPYGSYVSAAAPDGSRILWGGRNSPGLNITRLADGAVVRAFDGTVTNAAQTSWSPGGQLLAVASLVDNAFILRLDNGERLPPPKDSVLAAGAYVTWTFLSSNELLVGGIQSSELWRVDPPEVLWRADRVLLAADALRNRGLTLNSDAVELIRLNDGSVERQWTATAREFSCASFRRDGMRIALGRIDGVVEIRDVPRGEIVERYEGALADSIQTLAWDVEDGQLAVMSSTGLHVWRPGSVGSWRTLAISGDSLRSIAISPKGNRLLAIRTAFWSSGLVRIDTATGTEEQIIKDSTLVAVGQPGSGFVATVRSDGTLIWCDPESLQPRATNRIFENAGALANASAAARVLLTERRDRAALLDSISGEPVIRWEIESPGSLRSAALAPDGTRAAVVLFDRSVRVWLLDGATATETGRWDDALAWNVTFAKGGVLWGVSGAQPGGGSPSIWRWTPGSPATLVPLEVTDPQSAAFSADFGLVLVQDGTRGVAVCRTDTGRRIAWVHDEAVGGLLGLVISPTGDRWFVSRLDCVTTAYGAPLWLTPSPSSGPETVEFDILGLSGAFQIEQRPLSAGAWLPVGPVQPGPRLAIPTPGTDVLWRARTVGAE